MLKNLIISAVLLALVAVAETPKIVVSFPAYDQVLKEAFPQAEVILLTRDAANDPHQYQLTPADLQLLYSLTEKDVIISTAHAPFELKIAELANEGKIKAYVIDVRTLQLYLTWDNRLVKLEDEEHGEVDHEDHEHGPVNIHDHGIYPPNVFKLVEEVSWRTGLQPNKEFLERLRALNATYCCRFGGRAVALTPAAQYLLHWLGFRDVVVLVKEPGVPPSPADLQKALQYVRDGAPAVAVAVSGEALRIVDQFLQKAKEMGIQPKIITSDFSKGYLSALENATRQIAESTPQRPTQQVSPTAPMSGQQGGDIDVILPLIVVAAAVAAVGAFLALRRNRKTK